MIGIFNRSHYEDVLAPSVHGEIDKKTVAKRLAQINAWEETLAQNDVILLKFFLHISREAQTERLQARIDNPEKHWKLSPADFVERQYWEKYIHAYEHILSHTSQPHAPWYIIPSDHKWYRNTTISTILVEAMRSLKLKYPQAEWNPAGIDLKKLSPEAAAKKAVAATAPSSPK
jgi:polyphosphate kinase 2 (PPK2 family)